MTERSLWWFKNATDEGKDVLVFDSGHEIGDLHIYTHEKSIPAKEIRERAEEEFGHSHDPPFLAQDLGKLEFREPQGKRWTISEV